MDLANILSIGSGRAMERAVCVMPSSLPPGVASSPMPAPHRTTCYLQLPTGVALAVPSRREFEERFLFPQRPVIMSGAMEGGPALERWTNDYLKEKVGARTVHPYKHKDHARFGARRVLDPKNGNSDTPPMKLAEYIDLLAGADISDGLLYIALLTLRTTLPELWPDVRLPPYFDDDKFVDVRLWLGPGNNFTPLRYDPNNNFLGQLRGRKQVMLCPPREITRVYPFPFSYAANHFSQVNVLSPDLTRFPACAHADRALLELGPGDLLFIPFYWWHAVWGIDQNISINYWWDVRRTHRLQHPRQTARLSYRTAVVNFAARRAAVQSAR